MNIDRAARIAGLKQHPAWGDLVAEIDETVERYSVALAKTMLATGKPPETPSMSFEYKRGYLAGMKAVTRHPDTATAALRKEMARQTEQEEPVE